MKVTVVFEVNLKETQNVIRKLKKSDRLMVNLPPTFPEIVIIKWSKFLEELKKHLESFISIESTLLLRNVLMYKIQVPL